MAARPVLYKVSVAVDKTSIRSFGDVTDLTVPIEAVDDVLGLVFVLGK